MSAQRAPIPPLHQASHIENRWPWRVEVAQDGVSLQKTVHGKASVEMETRQFPQIRRTLALRRSKKGL